LRSDGSLLVAIDREEAETDPVKQIRQKLNMINFIKKDLKRLFEISCQDPPVFIAQTK